MKNRAYSWEIKDLVAQFIAAFDDVVIGRFNRDRVEQDRIEVAYVFQPKRRVIHDIQNKAQTLKLPLGAVIINNVKRNPNRAFNKIYGFTYPNTRDANVKPSHTVKFPSPVPVDITVTLSLIATYQTDMDQLISNFAAYANPYIMVSWLPPAEYGLPATMPINTKVEWDNNINIEYPVDIDHSGRSVITADASFIIEGWLFKEQEDIVKNIYFIDANFHNTRILSSNRYTSYDDYGVLSGEDYTYSEGRISITDIDVVSISGSPTLTNVFFAPSGASRGAIPLIDQSYTIESPGTVILYGKRFNYTDNVYISSNNLSVYGTLTASPAYTYYPTFSAAALPLSSYRIITDNIMEIVLPTLSAGKFNIIVDTLVGWDTSYTCMSGHFIVL